MCAKLCTCGFDGSLIAPPTHQRQKRTEVHARSSKMRRKYGSYGRHSGGESGKHCYFEDWQFHHLPAATADCLHRANMALSMCPTHGMPVATMRRSPMCSSQPRMQLNSLATPCPLRQSAFTGAQLSSPALRSRRSGNHRVLTVCMASKGACRRLRRAPHHLNRWIGVHAHLCSAAKADGCYSTSTRPAVC